MRTKKQQDAKDKREAKAAKQTETPQEEKPAKRTMSETLQRYRGKYKATTSSNGRSSLSIGDVVAVLLEGQSPSQVVAVAERALGMKPGTLWAKYEKLNPGQQRMNAGNRIRAAVKRGELNEKQLKAAIH